MYNSLKLLSNPQAQRPNFYILHSAVLYFSLLMLPVARRASGHVASSRAEQKLQGTTHPPPAQRPHFYILHSEFYILHSQATPSKPQTQRSNFYILNSAVLHFSLLTLPVAHRAYGHVASSRAEQKL